MALPLMPKATAVWLVDNTSLSFEQIAEFCGMHPLEVQGIADGEVATGIIGVDPVGAGQLTAEEIRRCEADKSAKLKMKEDAQKYLSKKVKGARYTPVARRADKPDAIAWLLKYHPELTDAHMVKLIGTTKNTIEAVRNRTHWNTPNLRPKDPVLLGLCTQTHLDDAVRKAQKNMPVQAQAANQS
jgi:uncharacterized protein